MELLKELSASGDRTAQFDLASLYYLGVHVDVDKPKAKYLWAESCKSGFLTACTNLGSALVVSKDYDSAEYVLTKSAEEGDKLAIEYLIEIYNNDQWDGYAPAKAAYWKAKLSNDE